MFGSLLGNNLGQGAATIVAAAKELPQLKTLCGIPSEKADVDFSRADFFELFSASDDPWMMENIYEATSASDPALVASLHERLRVGAPHLLDVYKVHVRATNLRRSQQSAQSLLQGWYK